jgi:hypothetical protein
MRTFENPSNVPPSPEISYACVMLNDFESLIENFPGSEEIGSQFGEPFDHDKLHPPLTPRSLRAALNPQLDSIAAEVLEALAE